MDDDDPDEASFAQHRARPAQDAQRSAQHGRTPGLGSGAPQVRNGQDRVGRTVAGTHRLERVLCAGAAGVLYAATHLRVGRALTLHHLQAPPVHDAAQVAWAVRDVRALVRLEHPAVVDLHDVLLDSDGSVYLVLERLDGESLDALVASRGPLDPEHAISLLAPVIDAMALAHRHGLVHGALARESILVTPAGVSKVVDLGIAQLCVRLGGRPAPPIPLAPEQAIGAPGAVGPWTDVWSLGAIAYGCLADCLPYDEHADAAAMTRGAIVPIEARRPDLPEPIVLALRRALARDPGHRFRDAGELLRALRDDPSSSSGPHVARGALALSAAAKLAGAAVAITAAIGGVSLAGSLAPPRSGGSGHREPVGIAALARPSGAHAGRGPRRVSDHDLRSGCWPDERDVD